MFKINRLYMDKKTGRIFACEAFYIAGKGLFRTLTSNIVGTTGTFSAMARAFNREEFTIVGRF